jgi:hypothetical protein
MGGQTFAAGSDSSAELKALQAEMQAQQSILNGQTKELSGLRADQGQTWLTEQRAEQVKTLVREVLSDADTRASLMDSAITAGHNGKNFFLASEDGNFLLTVDGQMQIRYVWNHIRDDGGSPNDNEGFQIRRAKLGFYGHVYDPKLTYGLRIAATGDGLGRVGGSMNLEEAWAAYDVADGWNVKGGQFKAPFLREEAVDSRYQLAVERSIVNDIFTVDFTQGVQVGYAAEQWRAMAMVHDGSYGANVDYPTTGADRGEVDVALAGRVEYLAMGSWSQFDDFQTWSDDQMGLLLGAAVDYENAEGDTSATTSDVLKWTIDASFEAPETYGFNAFAALIGQHLSPREGGQFSGDQYGVVVQAAAFVIPDQWDVFARWEYVDFDHVDTDGDFLLNDVSGNNHYFSAMTFGTNYYMHKHGSKFSLDVVWTLSKSNGLFDATDTGSATTHGLIGSNDDNQIAIRAQYQLLF